jgi:hypothetical protein
MSGLSKSLVNPYAPPESSFATRAPSRDTRPRRSILASLVVFPTLFVLVPLVFAWPLLGISLLFVLHAIDRRFFRAPPFLS